MENKSELTINERVGKVEVEVHNLNTNLTKLFGKFDEYVEKAQPKPMSPYLLLTSAVAILTIIALMFGSVIYISNSATAPVVTQVGQMASTMNALNANILQTNSNIQLTNKELTGLQKQNEANAETLQWLLFDENIPKQVIQLEKDVEFLKNKVGR